MASILEIKIDIVDRGAGVQAEATMMIRVGNDDVKYKLSHSELNLNATQQTNLQAVVDAIRNKAENRTRNDFTIS